MTTHELARTLLEGPDLMVTISDYERGVDEVDTIRAPAPIHLNQNSTWYYGKHEYHDVERDCYSCNEDGAELPLAIQLD